MKNIETIKFLIGDIQVGIDDIAEMRDKQFGKNYIGERPTQAEADEYVAVLENTIKHCIICLSALVGE